MLEVDGFSGKANVLGRVVRVELLAGAGPGNSSSLMIHGLSYVDAMEVLAALDTDRLRSVPDLRVGETGGRQVYQERVGIAHDGSGPAPGPAVRQGIGDAQARPVVVNMTVNAGGDPDAVLEATRRGIHQGLREPVEVPRVLSPSTTIPPEVSGARELRPVVEWLWAGSHLTPEAQVETMKALADSGHCPLLATMFATMPEPALFAEVAGCMTALGYSTDGSGKPVALTPAAPPQRPMVAPPAPAPAPAAPSTPPAPAAASPGAVAAHAEGAPAEVPPVVKNAQHLRVVVDYVVERLPAEQRGSLEAVTRAVAALGPSVPMVARIESAKLKGRVERTMVSMDLLPTA